MADETSKEAKETLKTFTKLKETVETIKTSLEQTTEAIKELNKAAKKTNSNIPNDSIESLKKVVDELNPSVDSLSKTMSNLGKGVADKIAAGADKMKNMAENVDEVGGGMDNIISGASFKELKREVIGLVSETRNLHAVWRVLSRFVGTKWGVAIAASIGAISGFYQGLKNAAAILKSMGGLLGSVSKGMFRFATSIISIPFKLLSTLIDIAKSGPMGTEFLQAIEDLRKEFGSLRNEVNKTVFEISRSFKGFNQTGLSTFRVFGNWAERLNFLRENFKAMGFAFDAITKELHESAGVLLAYQKALGMTGEDMKGLTQYAVSMGRSLEDVQNQITKHTLKFSGGVIDKRFSRQVVKAVQDVKHFGGATVKEISVAAAYAKNLRVELEAIVGTLDAFETFDAAADSAARLSQAFGLQVDAFKLVQAQDPAEQIDMLRKSFFAAGRSADNFNRQQLNLLAQTTGLDAATAKLVFSQKNRGKSLDELKKKGQAAENQQLSQAEAMKKIADAIERLVKPMHFFKGGYFAHFFQGMKMGIERSRDFRMLIFEIRRGLMEAFRSGIKFGRMFMQTFPGLLDTVKSLRDVLNAKRIRKFFDSISAEVISFSKDLTNDQSPASFARLMTRLKKVFFDYFDTQMGPGKKFLSSIKKFLKSLSFVFAGGVHWIMTELSKTFKVLTKIVTHPDGVIEAVKQGATKSGGIVYQMIQPILSAIIDAWPQFSSAFVELIKATYEKLKKVLTTPPASTWLAGAFLAMFTVSFGPVVTRTLTAMLGTVITGIFSKGIGSVANSAATGKSIKSVMTSLFGKGGTVTKVLGPSFMKIAGSVFAALFVAAIGIGVSEGMKKYKTKISDSFDDAEKTIAAGSTGIVDMLTFGLIPDFLLDQVPEFFAKLTKKIRGSLNELLGGLGEDIVGYLDSYMTMFQGIGDILVGIFSGDTDRIGSGILNLIEGVFGMTFGYIKIWFVKLPMLITKYAVKAVTSIYAAIINLVADGLEKIGLKRFSKVIRGFSDSIKKFGDWIGGVIDSVGSVITELGKAVSKGFSIFGKLFSDDGDVGGAMDWIDKHLVGFLEKAFDTIKEIFKGLSGKSDSPIGKILYLARIFFQVTTPIGIAVTLIWGAFKSLVAAYEWLTDGMDKENSNLSKVVKVVYIAVKSVALGIGFVIDQFVWLFSTLFETQTKIYKALSRGFKKLWDTIGNFFKELFPDLSKSVMDGFGEIGEAISWVGEKLGESVDWLYDRLGGGKSELSAEEAARIEDNATDVGRQAVRAAKTGLGKAKKKESFSIGDIFNMDFSKIGEMSGGQIGQIKTVVDDVKDVTKTLDEFDPALLDALAQKLTNVFSQGGSMDNFVMQLNSLNVNGIESASKVMQNYRNLIVSSAEGMKAGGIAVALNAVQDMVDAANKLDETLSDTNIGKINVLAKLKNVANSIGLGGKMKYTIKNKDVNINLDVTVVMKADEVEKVILQRKKSRIRNRLNNVTYDQSKTKGYEPKIPNTLDANTSPIGDQT